MRVKKTSSLLLALGLLLLVPAGALAAAFAQGYLSEQEIPPGTLVQLEGGSGRVKPAEQDQSDDLIGVTVSDQQALVTSRSTEDTVQVVTSGLAAAAVSDVNGEINTGDRVAVSPLNGVGQKATASGKVLGIARGDWKDYAKDATESEVTDSKGSKVKIRLASMPVEVNPVYFDSGDVQSKLVPKAFQKVFETVAGKPVSGAKALLVMVMFLASLVFISILLGGAVRSSLISIGRNPLAKTAVYKGLWQIILIALGVLALSMAIIYIVLTAS